MHDEQLDPELNNFAQQLAGLQPAQTAVDRDQVMFAAGERSQRSRARRNVWASVGLGMAIAVLGVALPRMYPTPGQVVERLVYLPQPATKAGERIATTNQPTSNADEVENQLEALSPQSYFKLRKIVFTQGVDALPDWHRQKPREAADDADSSRHTLRHELQGS